MVELGLYLDESAFRGHAPHTCKLDFTPVDFVANAIVAVADRIHQTIGRTFHLTNIAGSMSYPEVGRVISRAGYAAHPAPYARFQRALASRCALDGPKPSLAPLLTHFPAPPGGSFHVFGWFKADQSIAFLSKAGVVPPAITAEIVKVYMQANMQRSDSWGGNDGKDDGTTAAATAVATDT